MLRFCVVACALILLGHTAPAYAHGACRGTLTNDTLRPVPPSLAPAVIAAFGVRMTPAEAARQTVIRCDHGEVLACMSGANLNCGQADTRRVSRGGDTWCHDHPNAAFIPMFATGHATIYTWRCDGTRAVPERQAQAVDARGFVAAFWRRINA